MRSPHGYRGPVLSDAWAIAGTVAVSASTAVTAAMAWYTKGLAQKTSAVAAAARQEADAVVQQGQSVQAQAEATVHLVELTRKSLQAAVLPWLTLGDKYAGVVPVAGRSVSGGVAPLVVSDAREDVLEAAIVVRNVGNGLALIDSQSSFLVGWNHPRSARREMMNFNSGSVGNPVVPPGEQVTMHFGVPLPRWQITTEGITNQDQGDGEFALDVVYADALGEQRTRVRFRIARTPPSQWDVFSIEYYTPPDAEATQTSVRVS